MGHGIFPYYGPSFTKSVAALLSRAEAKEVFYTSKKEKKARLIKEKEEENQSKNKRKNKK